MASRSTMSADAGGFSPNTVRVTMIAITPSEKASNLTSPLGSPRMTDVQGHDDLGSRQHRHFRRRSHVLEAHPTIESQRDVERIEGLQIECWSAALGGEM